MREQDVTDEQILEEARGILSNPQLRRCNQCAYANADCTRCNKIDKPLTKFMYAGMCKFYETNEEKVIRETREALKRQEKEEQKVNHILTMALNCIEASMLFLEDFAERVEKEYHIAERKGQGNPQIRKADRLWISNLKKASNEMKRGMEIARRQYNHFVMPIFNKVFYDKDVKEYDVEMYDDHMSDSWELASLVLRYFDVAFLNKRNADQVMDLMKTMDSYGVLTEEDFKRYNYRR